MKTMNYRFLILTILSIPSFTVAKVDLVTLPAREMTQLTIYNSADLTLVRDARGLTLKNGLNQLQFSWENTLIDPTSLEMIPRSAADRIDVFDLTFPPRVQNLGLWNIRSELDGKVPFEITYFTSGISWRAFYMGTLSPDESTMRLQGYVRVTNNSGEDYENAQTRLVVGKVHLLDQIAQLAQQQPPYGHPGQFERDVRAQSMRRQTREDLSFGMPMLEAAGAVAAPAQQKVIIKEGLSEYFLYTIEGTETISTGWSKRLPSFDTADIPVVNLYKYEAERYGNSVIRLLSFNNDEDHRLGETPIPNGQFRAYRTVDQSGHLSYEGQSALKYIPVGEEVEVNLGPVQNVVVEPVLMNYHTENYRFNNKGNIHGWDEVRTFRFTVKNTRDLAVKLELTRNLSDRYWSLESSGDYGEYEQIDLDTVRYTLELSPQSVLTFEHTVRTYHGIRRQEWQQNQR